MNSAKAFLIFEKRFEINKDENQIEILKYFLEKFCLAWQKCDLMKYTVTSEWIIWRKSFCDTYSNTGWSSIRYALDFKYQSGPLLCNKKETLLLEVRKTINKGILADLI